MRSADIELDSLATDLYCALTWLAVVQQSSLGMSIKVNSFHLSLRSRTSLCKGSASSNFSVSTYKQAKLLAILVYCSAICASQRISSSEWPDFYKGNGTSVSFVRHKMLIIKTRNGQPFVQGILVEWNTLYYGINIIVSFTNNRHFFSHWSETGKKAARCILTVNFF